MKDFVVIVQGASSHVTKQKESLRDANVIFSTWIGEESKYTNDDIVLFNQKPSYLGPCNLNLQKQSTLAGLFKAKEMGFTRALKIRSDLTTTNYNQLFNLIDNEDLNFLCWHHHEVYPKCPGYLVDYLMSGKIDDLIKLWEINDMSKCKVPEIILTEQYINKLMNSVEISYFLPKLNGDNDLHWLKNNLMLSSYQANNKYDKFGKFDFSANKQHLALDYMKFLIK